MQFWPPASHRGSGGQEEPWLAIYGHVTYYIIIHPCTQIYAIYEHARGAQRKESPSRHPLHCKCQAGGRTKDLIRDFIVVIRRRLFTVVKRRGRRGLKNGNNERPATDSSSESGRRRVVSGRGLCPACQSDFISATTVPCYSHNFP